ncbi:Prolyl tripeptidyl peptidase precursor [Roseimaritima multifibrata]|uniref:Prolyl tripeptidyl peptidase n=1 Tax=Roseimaritima multifibrata TaxID=1930274 RepID=A0A517MDK8_9BACT|nr:DPP IV N-terminal domain-containing protein [Roseimaritima multifibrata]QDS92867.1 Prolyl tripeptidyl peptidase precursor [Roseimaritima multifibrata]
MKSNQLRIAIGAFACSVCCSMIVAQDANPAPPPNRQSATAPPLTVRSLFHPTDRFDYDGPDLAATKWVKIDGQTKLAIQRPTGWQLLNPASGKETLWSGEASIPNGLQRVDKGLVLFHPDAEAKWITRDASQWNHPTLSPDGQKIAFVEGNDLYLFEVQTGQRRRITDDGSATTLNGILDWSYQEEIYGRGNFRSLWWSPDSQRVAFLRLDISRLHTYTLADSDTPRGKVLTARYPKVGDPVPLAQLWVTDLTGNRTLIADPAAELEDIEQQEPLIVRVGWHPDSRHVVYQVTNRIQNWIELRQSSDLTDPTSSVGTTSKDLLRDESAAWVEVLGEPRWLPDGSFLWLSDQPVGRRRVWWVSANGDLRSAVSPADMDVRDIIGMTSDGKTVYVNGDAERGSVGQQIYRIQLKFDDLAGEPPSSLMEPITTEKGWHDAEISPDGLWMVDRFSTVSQPPRLDLVSLDVAANPNPSPRTLQKGYELTASQIPVKWLTIPSAAGQPLPAYLIRPTKTPATGLPVLVETYGGPQAPAAVDRWQGSRYLFRQMLAHRGIAVLVVDNRSSAGQGIADTWQIYRRVGEIELEDTLAAVDWLRKQDWVEKERIGLRGWSFGGFLTAYAMTHSDAFAAGVAGGSPTDWRNYDAIYTERYMDLPDENREGYEATSVNAAAQHLKGKLLLIHGELDDNVHPANTLQLSKALQMAGKTFDLMIYPGAAHAIRERHQEHHMMQMVTRFLEQHLKDKDKKSRSNDRR